MVKLTQIPPEILCMVAQNLLKRSQRSLALTSRALRRPAQEALHRLIKIDDINGMRLPLLLQTLIDRPEFASQVRSISITVPNVESLDPERLDQSRLRNWESVVWAARDMSLNHNFLTAWGMYVRAMDPEVCASFMLAMIPKLQYFSLHCNNVGTQERYKLSSWFGIDWFADSPIEEICESLPFFRTVKSLRLDGGSIDRKWLQAPNLDTLRVEGVNDISLPDIQGQDTCVAKKLYLSIDPVITVYGPNLPDQRDGAAALMSCMKQLTSLYISVSNPKHEFKSALQLNTGCQACNVRVLIATIIRNAPTTLTRLHIYLAQPNPTISRCTHEDALKLPSLKKLTSLTHLSISELVLQRPYESSDMLSFLTGLPSTLEELSIYEPAGHYCWIVKMAQIVNEEGLKNLRKFVFRTNNPKNRMVEHLMAWTEGCGKFQYQLRKKIEILVGKV